MKKLLIFIGIIIFLIAALFVIYRLTYALFDKYNDTRLDPVQLSKIKIDSTKNYNYIFLGDSHCQYWKTNKQNVLNIGLTGQTSGQIKIKTELISNQLKGKNLIISMGANDVKSVATNPERVDQIVNDCIENINEVLKITKPRFKTIYIITVPPDFKAGWQQKIFNYSSTKEAKKEINNKIRQLAKNQNLNLIDTEKIFEGKENLSEDGIHMNEKAYQMLDEYVK